MLVLAPTGQASDERQLKISEAIKGLWTAIDGTSNGEAAPPGFLASMVFEFKDGFYRGKSSGQVPVRYTVDDTKKPAWIDIHNSLNQVGIAEIRDGKLRLCFGVHGDRPAEFKTKPYTDQTYLLLTRKNAEQVAPVDAGASPIPK